MKYKKTNGYYTQEFKDKVLDRLESPTDDTVASLSEEFEVSKSAIYHWIRLRRGQIIHLVQLNEAQRTNFT